MRLGNDPQKRLISLKILLEAASGARIAKSSGGRRSQNGGHHMLHAEEQCILQRRIL
jgi:hypothetical protein